MNVRSCVINRMGDFMNISSIATGMAGVGLAAAVRLNTGVDCLAKWQAQAVMALASTAGTGLSLVQCLREGRNVSSRTLATLATNACILAYSYLQPWAEVTNDQTAKKNGRFGMPNECLRELNIYGDLISPKCSPYLEDAEVLELIVEKYDDDVHGTLWVKNIGFD